jgi:hypothetical protein
MQRYTFADLMQRCMTGSETFCLAYDVDAVLQAIQMALNTYDSTDTAAVRVIEEIRETVRHALGKEVKP